jgi:hypothetical protein
LVEVKYRGLKESPATGVDLIFKYRTINNYISYWKDTILIIVFNVRPHISCICVQDIDWNYHLCGKIHRGVNKTDEIWNFCDIEKDIKDIFPRVHAEHIFRAKKLLRFED